MKIVADTVKRRPAVMDEEVFQFILLIDGDACKLFIVLNGFPDCPPQPEFIYRITHPSGRFQLRALDICSQVHDFIVTGNLPAFCQSLYHVILPCFTHKVQILGDFVQRKPFFNPAEQDCEKIAVCFQHLPYETDPKGFLHIRQKRPHFCKLRFPKATDFRHNWRMLVLYDDVTKGCNQKLPFGVFRTA